jgi:hypothetical protein
MATTKRQRTDVHRMKNGRYIVAKWDDRQAQFRSSNIERVPFQGYVYSYGPTLESLAKIGIRTYALRSSAVRVAKRLAGEEE